MLTICEDGIDLLLEYTGVLGIINKWVLVSRIDIYNMSKMARRNDIS